MNRSAILSINSGSSSLKVALFEMPNGPATIRRIAGEAVSDVGDARDALDRILAKFARAGHPAPRAVGHRIVHGGSRFVAPVLIDDAVVRALSELMAFAPVHMPAALAGIEAVKARLADVPQVACFDTAFHATLPEEAWRLPLPRRFVDVRRYGFHGLSYEYIVSTFDPIPPRMVVAHLGHGASLVALRDGRSVDTTMGMTPTGGIPMSTRAGDLDPGAIVHLLRAGLSVEDLARVVDRESGLEAIGGSHDMKTLLERRASDARADLAVRVFARAIAKTIGAYAAVLGGLDALVFTGGIGEHAPAVREDACETLAFLGIALEPERNARSERTISSADSRTPVFVVPTDEDRMVAVHTARIVGE